MPAIKIAFDKEISVSILFDYLNVFFNMTQILAKFLKISDDDQIKYLQDMESEDSAEKWNFFASVISQAGLDDLVIIEALDILASSDIPEDERANITKTVIDLAKHEQDVIIRQHAVMCLQNDDLVTNEVVDYARAILLDSTANIDLRYNALVIVNNHLPKSKLAAIFQELTKDSALGSKAENWLKDL